MSRVSINSNHSLNVSVMSRYITLMTDSSLLCDSVTDSVALPPAMGGTWASSPLILGQVGLLCCHTPCLVSDKTVQVFIIHALYSYSFQFKTFSYWYYYYCYYYNYYHYVFRLSFAASLPELTGQSSFSFSEFLALPFSTSLQYNHCLPFFFFFRRSDNLI